MPSTGGWPACCPTASPGASDTAHPTAVEQAVLPDAEGRRRSRRRPGLRHALGLRAGLPRVRGVAHPDRPPDGRGGLRVPPGGVPVPRYRRAADPGGFSPPGPIRRHHHPTTGAASGWCARVRPCGGDPSTTGCGQSPSTGTSAAPARSWY